MNVEDKRYNNYQKVLIKMREKAGDYARFSQEISVLEDVLSLTRKGRTDSVTSVPLERKAEIYQDLLDIRKRIKDPVLSSTLSLLRKCYPIQFRRIKIYLKSNGGVKK